MLRYMLDADICIHLFRSRTPDLRAKFKELTGALALSSVTLMELMVGAEKLGRREEGHAQIRLFVANMQLLAFDLDAAGHAAEIRATLERAGRVIGPYDLMVAGHARARGLIVATGNLREFERVDGLRCEDWTRAPA